MRVQEEWRQFERRATDLNNVIHEYCMAIESMQNWSDWLDRKKVVSLHKAKREMVYIALRRRFVDPNTGHHESLMSHTRISLVPRVSPEYQANPSVRYVSSRSIFGEMTLLFEGSRSTNTCPLYLVKLWDA